MHCDACGTQVAEDARFCPACGKRLSPPAAPDVPVTERETAPETEHSAAPGIPDEPPPEPPTAALPESVTRPDEDDTRSAPETRADDETAAVVDERQEQEVAAPAPEPRVVSQVPPREPPPWAVNAPTQRIARAQITLEGRDETIIPATPLPEDVAAAQGADFEAAFLAESGGLYPVGLFRRFVALAFDFAIVIIVPVLLLEFAAGARDSTPFLILAGGVLLLYFPIGFSVGRTVGAWAMHVRIVRFGDDDGAHHPGPVRGVVRSLVMLVSIAALFVGFFWALMNGRRQTWHDKVAGTIVVDARGTPLPSLAA